MTKQFGTMEEVTFTSDALNQAIPVLIYLPVTYSPLKKSKLLIVQDGKDYFQLGRIGRRVDMLLKDGEISDVIVVGIPYKNIQDRRDKYHPDGSQHDAYVRFLGRELVPYLEERFETFQVGTSRILMGNSLGATVSFLTAIKYPHSFQTTVLFSPLIEKNMLESAEKKASPGMLNMYHIIGTEEIAVDTTGGTIEDFVAPNRAFHEKIESRHIPHHYHEFHGDHTWTYWQKEIDNALRYVLKKD